MVTESKTINAECPRKRILDVGKVYVRIVHSVRVGAPPSCHWKEVREALATQLTKCTP